MWGICLMMLSGFLGFAATPGTAFAHLTAVGFGVGAGFTMDEFALWVHLQDVYWEHEGRRSIDATIIATAFAALVVAGTTPFGLDDPGSVTGTAVVVGLDVLLAALCFLKGRILLGVLGLFVPIFALIGAVRLAQPGSPWARRRYSPERLAKRRGALLRRPLDRQAPPPADRRAHRRDQPPLTHARHLLVLTVDSSHSPRLVKPIMIASIQYCERAAARPLNSTSARSCASTSPPMWPRISAATWTYQIM